MNDLRGGSSADTSGSSDSADANIDCNKNFDNNEACEAFFVAEVSTSCVSNDLTVTKKGV